MSNSPNSPNNSLQTLKQLFQNSPEVLRMLDARELDLADLESEAYIQKQQEANLFPQPVNFYATGRTGAGKTSLGNTLLDPGKGQPMESHGHQDCTSSVQYFTLASNLQYFDLPGAGSSEKYENINRAALLVKQIEDEDEEIYPVSQLEIFDFSSYETEGVKKGVVTVEDWQSNQTQQSVAADVILYVVAPHMQFTRDDKRYLRALLKSQKERRQSQKIIFALNIHRTADGQLKPTPQNLEDVRRIITEEVYQKLYPNQEPLMVEVDSLTGAGLSKITEFICDILPPEKLGNMQESLKGELKQYAQKERSKRYRQALIYIASRLATYPVDTPLGEGIVNEAYTAIANYGISIFKEEEAMRELQNAVLDELAAETKKARTQDIETAVDKVELRDEKREKVEHVPEVVEKQVPESTLDFEEQRSAGRAAGGALVGAGTTAGAAAAAITAGIATGGLAVPVVLGIGAALGGLTGGAVGAKKQLVPVKKISTRTVKVCTGVKEIKEEVTEQVPHVVKEMKKVGEKFLQGGYPVVANLLAIGLGVEEASHSASINLQNDFNSVVASGQKQVKIALGRYEAKINQLAESNDPDAAELEILKILEKALLT